MKKSVLVMVYIQLTLVTFAAETKELINKSKKYNIDTNDPEFKRKLQENYLKLLQKNFNMDKHTARKLKQTLMKTNKPDKKSLKKKKKRKLMLDGALGGGLAIGGGVLAGIAGRFLLKRYQLVQDINTLHKRIKFSDSEIDKYSNLEKTVHESFFNAYQDALGKVKKLEEMLKNKSVWLESDIDAALQEEEHEESNQDDDTGVIEEAEHLDENRRHRRRRRKKKLL